MPPVEGSGDVVSSLEAGISGGPSKFIANGVLGPRITVGLLVAPSIAWVLSALSLGAQSFLKALHPKPSTLSPNP